MIKDQGIVGKLDVVAFPSLPVKSPASNVITFHNLLNFGK
jgi:hypothetical protein